MNALKHITLAVALTLGLGSGLAQATDWQAEVQAVESARANTFQFSTQVRRLSESLDQARSRLVDRLLYLRRMDAGLAEVQVLLDREFEGKSPEKEVLARLTHEQMLKVKSLTPVLPDTPERLARDARIRELTLELRDSQTKAAQRFQEAKSAADPQKARAELVAAMRAEFKHSNDELLALQAVKRAEEEAAKRQVPAFKVELDRLGTLVKMGEFQDRQVLFASARKDLEADRAAVRDLEAQLVAAVAKQLGQPTR